MSHSLKPGDLALTLVDCLAWPAGSVVTLYVFCPAGTFNRASNCSFTSTVDEWVCTSDQDVMGQCYEPRHLMPLRGDFVPERQKSQEVPA